MQIPDHINLTPILYVSVSTNIALLVGGVKAYTRFVRFLSRLEFAFDLMWKDYCGRNNHLYVPLHPQPKARAARAGI